MILNYSMILKLFNNVGIKVMINLIVIVENFFVEQVQGEVFLELEGEICISDILVQYVVVNFVFVVDLLIE